MPVKFTMHFKNVTAPTDGTMQAVRTAKWTERHYVSADNVATARSIITTGAAPVGGVSILDLRREILPINAQLTHYTLQPYTLVAGVGESPAGGVDVTQVGAKGTSNLICDIPQQGALVDMILADPQPAHARFIVRGMPNDRVVAGSLNFTNTFLQAFRTYIDALIEQYGTYVDDRGTDPGIGVPIESVAPDGVVTPGAPLLFLVPGDMAKVTRTRDSDDLGKGGIFRVDEVSVLPNTVTLHRWAFGATTGGRIRKWLRVFAAYRTGTIVQQGTRKVGSPIDYKGRNNKKR